MAWGNALTASLPTDAAARKGTQTWLGSIVEAKTNLAIGFALNYCVNLAVLPILWNPARPALAAFQIGLVFTVVSVVRQILIRRYFNGRAWGHKEASA